MSDLRLSEVVGMPQSDVRISEIAMNTHTQSDHRHSFKISDIKTSIAPSEAVMSSVMPMITTESDEPINLDQRMSALMP